MDGGWEVEWLTGWVRIHGDNDCTKHILEDGDGDMELGLLEESQEECDFVVVGGAQ